MAIRSAVAAALTIATLAACGQPQRHEAAQRPQARVQVQSWDLGEALAERKRVVVDTCHQAGKGDDTAALLVAVIMGETNSCKACDRDTSKDGAGLARNFSAFNLNLDYLHSVGLDDAAAERLNDDAALPDAVRAVLAGLDKYGEDKFLSYHRGGATARDDGVSYGAVEYREAIRAVQQHLLGDKRLLTSGDRVGLYIPHV